jgi:NTE family protein
MQGLVLEGGGAKGAYQIGSYKALKEIGIEFNGIAGTSVGALNGAVIAQGDFDVAYEMWENIKPSTVLDLDDEIVNRIKKLDFDYDNFTYVLNSLKKVLKNNGIDTTKLRNLLNKYISEKKIRKSSVDFGLVTISLQDLKPMELFIDDIPKGKLVDYLMASANFPLFKTEVLEGKKFIDGAIYDNCPVGMLVNKGYKDIIVIRTFGLGRIRKLNFDGVSIKQIKPSTQLGGTLDFDNSLSNRNIKIGYFDTYRLFNDLRGKKYYINCEKDNAFERVFLNLNEEIILKIGKMLGYENIPYRRMLFEIIIPRIAKLLGLNRGADYEDLLVYLYERLAEKFNLEYLKIYSIYEFEQEIKNKIKSESISVKNMKDILIKEPQIINYRDNVLTEIAFLLINNV